MSDLILLGEWLHVYLKENGIKLEAVVIELIKKYQLNTTDVTKPRAALMSFSILALRRAKKIDQNIYSVLLVSL